MQYLHVLLVAVLSTLRLVSAQGVGNAAAQAACAGFAPNAMKCVRSVTHQSGHSLLSFKHFP